MSLEEPIRDAVHRIAMRWWKLRALETIGLAVVIGSAVGMILVPMFAWQSKPSWDLCGGVLALSLLIGVILASRCRPSEARAAIEADRQWHLNELLITAMGILDSSRREGIDPALRETVLQLAVIDLSHRNLNDLVLRRFTRRAWAGLGSLPVLLILFTGICSHPLVLRAAADARRSPEVATNNQNAGMMEPPQRSDRVSPTGSREGEEASDGSERSRLQASQARTERNTATDSTGGARARTEDANVAVARSKLSPTNVTNDAGATSGGNGVSGSNSADAWRGGRVEPTRTASPPWERPNWNEQQTRAIQSLEASPPPASYRDLIRDYFSR